MNDRPRILSLCTGYGGLDLAVEALTGGVVVAYAEVDRHAAKIAKTHYPRAKNHGDIKTIQWGVFGDRIDIITAGYPCQPFSMAGKRKGKDDERHLWPAVAEAIREVRPRVAYLENVRGHLTKGFDEVLGTLADLRYDAKWTCVRASDVGAPHRRERVFIVATDTHRHPAGRKRSAAPGTEERDAGRGEAELHHRPADEARGRSAGMKLLPTPTSRDWKDGWGPNLNVPVNSLLGRVAWTLPSRELLPTPTAWLGRRPIQSVGDPERWANPGRSREVSDCVAWCEREDAWGAYAEAINRWESLTRRAPEPSEIDDKGQRRLSPVFVEWMMGLPRGWVTDVDIPRTAMLKALGNGVVPQQAYVAYAEMETW